jgi:hypothetical protein
LESTQGTDLAPHSAIIQIRWEIHEQMPNGMFFGASKDAGLKVCELRGQSRSLAKYHLNQLLKLIEENSTHAARYDSGGIENPGPGAGEAQGAEGSVPSPAPLQSMRGSITRRDGR